MFGLSTTPVAFGALGTGLIFSASNIGIARNPEMEAGLFTNSLIGFALIETFVLIGLGVASAASVIF
jgi:F0F1-type ATP synthase membrane subunit c/vacuolar-type H+-ATPase subunit K